MVDLAFKMLLHDRLRFAITVSGVAFAVAMVLIQVGLFVGVLDNARITIDHTDADLWVTAPRTPNIDFAHAFPETRVERVRAVPGVLRADNLIVAFMNVMLPTGAEESTLVYALPDFRRWGLPWSVDAADLDDLRRSPSMILDDSATRRFGAFAPGDVREMFGRRLRILGRAHEAKSFTTTPITFMDYQLAQSLWPPLAGSTTFILVKLAQGADAGAVRAELQARLPHNDVLTKAEWASRTRTYWLKSTGIGISMGMTVLLGGLIGVIVVAQTLYASTMEHINEFGTVKAIGGSNADIYRILARQAGAASLLGYALGAVPSYTVREVMGRTGVRVLISPELAAAVFVGTVALCLLGALVSFRKVASIDPGLVFRT